MLTAPMDLDDKVWHYVLWFGGMFSGMIATYILQYIAGILGLDIINWVKKLIPAIKTRLHI